MRPFSNVFSKFSSRRNRLFPMLRPVVLGAVILLLIMYLMENLKNKLPEINVSPKKQPFCPDLGNNTSLRGPLNLNVTALLEQGQAGQDSHKGHPEVAPGGSWRPPNCSARHKVAIVVPYRNRQSHLALLLHWLFPILRRQQLDFRIVVTEQAGNGTFNKGRIMNAAVRFIEDANLGVDCVIFHDVDMIPEDDRVPYGCPSLGKPLHLGAYVDLLKYSLSFTAFQDILTGGVLAMRIEDFRAVNGYSNKYWGWGGEDDDMGTRIRSRNMTIVRPNAEVVRFSMVVHKKRTQGLEEHLLYKMIGEAPKRMDSDGLREGNKWNLTEVHIRPLYYHLLVDVGELPKEAQQRMETKKRW